MQVTKIAASQLDLRGDLAYPCPLLRTPAGLLSERHCPIQRTRGGGGINRRACYFHKDPCAYASGVPAPDRPAIICSWLGHVLMSFRHNTGIPRVAAGRVGTRLSSPSIGQGVLHAGRIRAVHNDGLQGCAGCTPSLAGWGRRDPRTNKRAQGIQVSVKHEYSTPPLKRLTTQKSESADTKRLPTYSTRCGLCCIAGFWGIVPGDWDGPACCTAGGCAKGCRGKRSRLKTHN